jgi:hypothetical protein
VAAKLHQGPATGYQDIQNGWILSGQPSYFLLIGGAVSSAVQRPELESDVASQSTFRFSVCRALLPDPV